MTTADRLALIAGVALAMSLPISVPAEFGYGWPGDESWHRWIAIIRWAGRFVLAINLGVTLAILARRVRFGGMPRPAEWLAIAVALILINMALPGVESAIYWVSLLASDPRPLALTRLDHRNAYWYKPSLIDPQPLVEPECWWLAGAGVLIGLAACAAIITFRRRMPGWLGTLLLTAAAWGLLYGTLPVIARAIWWYSLGWVELMPRSLEVWYRHAYQALGMWPAGLLFGVPAAAALLRGERSGWRWTEWVGISSAAVLAIGRSLDFLPARVLYSTTPGMATHASFKWRFSYGLFGFETEYLAQGHRYVLTLAASRAALVFWAVAVGWTSCMIVRRLGPTWDRWIG